MSGDADGDTTEGDAGTARAGEGSDRSSARRRAERALREVRRERRKATLIHVTVDAVAAFLLVDLLVVVLAPSWLPAQVSLGIPAAVAVGPLPSAVSVPTAGLVGAAAAVVVALVEAWLRSRTPAVERFEAVNPAVAEALRTARDAAADGSDSVMAARLYDDVLDRLGDTSGVALLDRRRIAATTVLVGVLSLVTLQVTVAGVALLDGSGGLSTSGDPTDGPREYEGLQDGDAILGDPENVTAGDDDLDAAVESTGGDEEVDRGDRFPGTAAGAGAGTGGVESQQAGFSDPERIEDAELVREYNLRIRADNGTGP